MLALFPLLVTCNCYLNLYSWLSWAARFMRMISINLNNYLVIKIHTSWCHAAYWFPRSSKLFHTNREYNGVGQELLFYWIIFILKQIISAERSLHAYFFGSWGKSLRVLELVTHTWELQILTKPTWVGHLIISISSVGLWFSMQSCEENQVARIVYSLFLLIFF